MYSPLKSVDGRGALSHQILPPVDQQLQFARHRIVAGHRQIRFAQRHTGHRLGINRI
jgi:hypothetical protein